MSNFSMYLVACAACVLAFSLVVLIFRAVILCENEKCSSSGLQMKNYSKASFLNALAKM
ncbi:MAG: hypothetical protein PHI20_04745 [Endomicrobiaceae bacterium]|nr:hypothetical protein [Endomicrobiaceae bacterium]MDD4165673.1 hypothetical protein [Endomicrobiaceae bacterium]